MITNICSIYAHLSRPSPSTDPLPWAQPLMGDASLLSCVVVPPPSGGGCDRGKISKIINPALPARDSSPPFLPFNFPACQGLPPPSPSRFWLREPRRAWELIPVVVPGPAAPLPCGGGCDRGKRYFHQSRRSPSGSFPLSLGYSTHQGLSPPILLNFGA